MNTSEKKLSLIERWNIKEESIPIEFLDEGDSDASDDTRPTKSDVKKVQRS